MVALSAPRPALRKGIATQRNAEVAKSQTQAEKNPQPLTVASAPQASAEVNRPAITAETRAFARGRAQERELLSKARVPGWATAPGLEQVGAGLGEMQRGMGGVPVAQMQSMLNKRGANLDVDGKFGPLTQAALKKEQGRQGIPATGRLDAHSLNAIRGGEGELGEARSVSGVPENIPGWQAAPSLDQVQTGEARMRRGMGGQSVAQVQGMLNENGASLEMDGKFGGDTERALLNFQRTRGLPDNATLGPRSLEALRTNAPATLPQAANDNAEAPAAAGNVNADTAGMRPNQRNLVALRNTTDADANGGRGRYDDQLAMLWTDSQGNKRVREYAANTEPSAQYRGRVGVDANGDGRKDQGRLPAGYSEFRTGRSSRLGRVLRPTQNQMAERDTNQDGLFNDNAHASAGQSILFHGGGRTNVSSAGCQTMDPATFNRFWSDINRAGNPGTIGYTLINAN
jgi:peptidoglycan hydrolase-like protein with peptidoglycan-binding domain